LPGGIGELFLPAKENWLILNVLFARFCGKYPSTVIFFYLKLAIGS